MPSASGGLASTMKLRHKETWSGEHAGIVFELCNWSLSDEQVVWNYYVYLSEPKLTKEQLDPFWLVDEFIKFSATSPIRRTHSYYKVGAFNEFDFHGGITYYKKIEDLEGQRCIKVGCDYNHLWDAEAGHPENFDSVLADTQATCKAVAAYFNLKQTTT